MSNQPFNFDISFLKVSLWVTLILAILKVSNVIDISTIWVLMPIIISVGLLFFVIFLIGLIVVYMVATGAVDINNETKKEEKTEDET